MSSRTVYVVGAGASYEINLPTGKELKDEIASLLNMRFEFNTQKSGDLGIQQALRQFTSHDPSLETLNDYLHECLHISANMPLAMSIDNFIDTEKENEKLALCGKLAIIKSILKAEKNSLLYVDKYGRNNLLNFSSLEDTWYLSFFRTLTENCNTEDLSKRFRDITLIIFNYDRCIEHFLLFSLMSYYRLNEDSASEIINNLEIIHPYGAVGSLRWLDPVSATSVEFGGELHVNQLIEYAQRIRTFTEGAHSEYIEKLRDNMKNTSRLVFLGFAFHRLNMKLLGGEGIDRYDNPLDINCFSTAYETSKSDQESIRKSISYLYKNEVNINIENTTCKQLFNDYSRSLGYT